MFKIFYKKPLLKGSVQFNNLTCFDGGCGYNRKSEIGWPLNRNVRIGSAFMIGNLPYRWDMWLKGDTNLILKSKDAKFFL
jgi:hypothetical protein